VGILGHIFGPIIDVLVKGQDPNTVSAASNLLATLFTFFNSGILVVGSIIVVYVAVMGAVNTANDGEAMGKRGARSGRPCGSWWRSVLLPSASGYSFIQMLVLTISVEHRLRQWHLQARHGHGCAQAGRHRRHFYQTGTYFGLRDFGKQYLAAAYCARAANTIYADSAEIHP
jgi:conjugal transfer/type IV secretion protein DotA/TraY